MRLLPLLPQESRLLRKLDPNNTYGFDDMLLSRIEFFLHLLVWRETKDAKHGNNKPEPIEPWAKKKKRTPEGQKAMAIDDVKTLLSSPRK